MTNPEQAKTGVELQSEESSAITKFMSLVRNLPDATEDMKIAIESHLKSHPSYLKNAALLSKMESNKPDFYGIATLPKTLTNGDWDDEDNVPELMTIFEKECLDKVIAKLEETITVNELTTRYEFVKSELGVLKNLPDSGDEVNNLLDEVSAFLPGDVNVPPDQRKAKVDDFEKRYKGLFAKYKTAAIPKLVREGLDKGEYDANTLSTIEKPSEFKAKAEEIREKKKAEDEAVKATGQETVSDAIGSAITSGTADLQGILDRLMNSQSPILATIAGLMAVLFNLNPGGMFDSLIGRMSPSETKEVFLSLATGKRKIITHPKEGDEAAAFTTFREKRGAAIQWLENLEIDGQKVGKKEQLCYSLFNTEYTVGTLRELSKGGNDAEKLDVEDLPGDYQDDFATVQYIYDQVLNKAPSDGGKDTVTLAEFISDPENGFVQPATPEPLVASTEPPQEE